MKPVISEVLSSSAGKGASVECPFSQADNHAAMCKCRGTKRIKACEECDGAGFDGKRQRPCQKCGGSGCFSASPIAAS